MVWSRGERFIPIAPKRCIASSSTASTKRALVHGDVSPKNILVGPTDRSFSMPNAPGSATRPSISASASTTCC